MMHPDARSSPAALRNREAIAGVLAEWLPPRGTILEVASGTGEHVVHFAAALPALDWQPSDPDPAALASIAAWSAAAGLRNLRPAIALDALAPAWPPIAADGVVAINMVHISPWAASLGLLDGAARLLAAGAPLVLYGPWIEPGVATTPSNLAFDSSLRQRNPDWGLRDRARFAAEAEARGFEPCDRRAMPANNVMLLFRRR